MHFMPLQKGSDITVVLVLTEWSELGGVVTS